MPQRRARRTVPLLAATGLVTAGLAAIAPHAVAQSGAVAQDGPGALSHFDLARKDCLGTARNTASKVWFTVADGVLSDVYEPTMDNTNVQSLQYVVTDGSSFTDLQSRDLSYTVSTDGTGMTCTVTATSAAHGYSLSTTYVTDPARDTVLMHTTLGNPNNLPLHVYARLDGHVNGNGGGGTDNGGADTGRLTGSGIPVIGDRNTVSEAANRDYAVPTFMALDATSRGASSVGFANTDSDGLTQLQNYRSLTQRDTAAYNGHIVATEDVTPAEGSSDFTLALGFGRTRDQAARVAAASAARPFGAAAASYTAGWRQYDAGLNGPAASDPRAIRRAYWLSANVLKASEDKTFPGAIAASLSSPWGQAVSAGALHSGKPVYFGSYREIFARDLYEAATGLLADGDVGTARAATRFLFQRQQLPTGEMPRNSLLNGKVAPDTGGIQLDETAYPLLLAYQTRLPMSRRFYANHIRPAANFLVAHGPSFGVERWEEQGGYSPSTIAAEIAGLTAAAHLATARGDLAHAQLYQAVADDFQRTVKSFTVTHTGPYSPDPYFIRVSKNGDPDSAVTYNLGNGSIVVDQRAVVDGGFQELVRLGELPADDPVVLNSLKVLDQQIKVTTPTGSGYYRYGTDATQGSVDGYGDCWVPDPTNCPQNGQPWPTTDTGSGHLWPVLSGERAESALALGNASLARSLLQFMRRSAAGVGLVPEQVWEDPDLPAGDYRSDPEHASIGFRDGHPAGSASPLTWAQAQEVRLITDLDAGRITDRPDITSQRYVTSGPPRQVPVMISSPAAGESVADHTTVTGTTRPGAHVVVSVINLAGTHGPTVATATADSTGAFSVRVPVGFASNLITVAATTARGTGVARVTVVGQLTGGTQVFDTSDPTGDDNGPGTYQYPTAADFKPGSFDLTRFQVITKNGTVYLISTVRDLADTFGEPDGAQLLDLYVRDPAKSPSSTAAAFPQRNYTIAPSDAWTERIEVQGFASPVWVDANGTQLGSPGVVADTGSDTITVSVPEAQFGTPSSGWVFTLALTGQDGFSSDQARGFAPTPQDYQFGVCAAGGTAPICSVDPNTVAKVMDTITPTGVSQADELDVTKGPVVLQGVSVP